MRTITRPIASALVISSDNNILMGRKDSQGRSVYVDCWHIPGGGIEEHETHIQALIREIKEEVGIDATNNLIELIDDTGTGTAEKTLKDTNERVLVNMRFFVYKVTVDQPSNKIPVTPSDDLVELQWFPLSELQKVKLTPPSVILFKKLGYIE